MLVKVRNAGAAGVVKDLSQHELPLGVWTDARNMRFLDGYCQPFLGHGSIFGQPPITPYHTLSVASNGQRYWLYAGAQQIYAATIKDGIAQHINLTRQVTMPGFKYVAQPAFGALGINAGTSSSFGTHAAVPPFGDTTYGSLLNGLLENARSGRVTAPSFSRSALQPGTMPANAPTGSAGSIVFSTVTTEQAYSMQPNQITSTLLSGIPIINPGNLTDPPQQWNLDVNSRFKALDNWPGNTYCKSLRAFKNFLVALNVTQDGQNYPHLVKWSSAADPGAVPATWNAADATQDAGQTDLAESTGEIVDGLPLRDFFMIYKADSIWRMTYTGGPYVFAFQKVLGTSGALNRNCIVELDGYHLVLTGSDVIIHDGQQPVSILDKQARRALFQDFDVSAIDKAFVFKNPFVNEVFVCYASVGSLVPDKALVYNYVDKTVSYRDLPNLHHANFGALDSTQGETWEVDTDPWYSDQTRWNGPDFTPGTVRVLMASANQKLYLLDSAASFDGVKPNCYLERIGLSLDVPERLKFIRGVRPRITGNVGSTVQIYVGTAEDPYSAPTYGPPMTHVIGTTVTNNCMVLGRYIALRIESGDAYFYRLDSYDLDYEIAGEW